MFKNYFNKLFIIGAVSIIITVLIVQYIFYNQKTQKKSKADTSLLSLSFDPPSIEIQKQSANQEGTALIKVQPSSDMTIRGYEFNINFNKNQLEVKDIDYKLGTTALGLGDNNSQLTAVNNQGLIKIRGQIQDPSGKILSNGTPENIVSIKFKLKNNIESSSVEIDPGSAYFHQIKSDSSIEPVSASSNVLTINLTPFETTLPPTETPVPTSTTAPGQPTSTPAPTSTPVPPSQCRQQGESCGTGFSGVPNGLGTCCSQLTCIDSSNPDQGGTCQIADNPLPTNTPIPTALPGEPTNTPVPTETTGPEQPTNTPIPTTSDNIVTLSLALKFQGIETQPKKLANQEMNVKVSLAGSLLPEPVSEITTVRANDKGIWYGTVDFSDIPLGSSYKVYIKGPKHLQKKVCETNPKGDYYYHCQPGESITLTAGKNLLDFSNIYMMVGDIPENGAQDGVINSYDIAFIRNNLGKTDPDVLDIGDFNLDGIIDTQDYSLLIAAMAVRYDEE